MMRLDAIQTIAQLDAFSAEAYVDALRVLVPSGTALEDADVMLRAEVGAIDRFTATAMRILLDAALVNDASVPATFRRTLAATVLQYEHDRDTLRERVAMTAARTDPDGAATTADKVAEAATRALGIRTALRDGVDAVAKERGLVPDAAAEPAPEPAEPTRGELIEYE
jgi:hypothetical protein